MKRPQIQSFEGLRGIAALLVVLYHVTALHSFAVVKAGYLAVDLFFILSGFVMCVSYGERLSSMRDFRAFMIARLARLAPLLVFSYVAYFVIANLLRKSTHVILPSIPEVIATLSMTFGLGLPHIRVFNFASWSISTEFYTYALFGLIWVAVRPARRASCAAILAATTAAALLVIDFALNHCGSDAKACLDNVASAGATIRCISGFFAGVLAFHVTKFTRMRQVVSHPASAVILSAIAISIISLSTRYGLVAFLSPIAFAFMIVSLSADSGPVAYLLKTSIPQTLGRLSYSLYLLHMPLLLIFDEKLEQFNGLEFFAWLAFFLASLILSAEATFRMIEQPGKKFVLWIFGHARSSRPSVTA